MKSQSRIWLQFNNEGLVKLAVASDSTRLCRDLIDLCEERFDVTSCYFVIPKKTLRCLPMVAFLVDVAGGMLVRTEKYDSYDWVVCYCEI